MKPLYKKSPFFAEKRGGENLLVEPQNRPILRVFAETLVGQESSTRWNIRAVTEMLKLLNDIWSCFAWMNLRMSGCPTSITVLEQAPSLQNFKADVWLTRIEAAMFLRLDQAGHTPVSAHRTLNYWRDKGELKATKYARRVWYLKNELLKFLENKTETA